MTEESPTDLNFGHFGIPAYDLENSQWTFARTSDGTAFRQLGLWEPIVFTSVNFPSPRVPRTLISAAQATESITRSLPELVPAIDHIPELEAVSAAATAALSTYDASIGQLMSFGTITSPESRARVLRQVVALATGEGGNILHLQLLSKERHGWSSSGKQNRSLCYLEGRSIKGDSGFWNEDAAAIHQVCFSRSEERGSFLAVRLPQRIVLFHPVYLSRPKAASKSRFVEFPPSSIDMQPFHSIRTRDTGNTQHADVSFNSHYQRQFAIVDQNSNWSVYDIDGTRRAYTVKRTASGSINMKNDLDSEEQTDNVNSWKEDGWARITWVGDANTILICNRRRLEMVDLKDPNSTLRTPQVINWNFTKSPSKDWILDIKGHPKNEKAFFVLTSTRLYLMEVTSLGDGPRDKSSDTDASIALSWTHFRGTEDASLQLNVQSLSDDEICVFLYSRLNAVVTGYRLTSQSSAAVPYCSSGPTTLLLDNLGSGARSKLVFNFEITRLEFKDLDVGPQGLGQRYADRGVQFYKLSAMFDDLSVAQTILCSAGLEAGNRSLLDVEPPSWAKLVRRSNFITRKTVSSDEDEEDFIEPDGLIDCPIPRIKSAFSLPERFEQPKTPHSSRDTFNFSRIYQALVSNASLPYNDAKTSPESIDILALAGEIRRQLEARENTEPFTLGTIQEYAGTRVIVNEPDEASAHLQDLFRPGGHGDQLELRRIAADRVLGFCNGEDRELSSVSSVYDLLLQNWVAPLPATIPARIRQSKERIARRIAAGVILASTRVRATTYFTILEANQSGIGQDSAIGFSSSLPHYSSQTESQLQSSQPSDPNDSPNLSTPLNPLARLSKHLHIFPFNPPDIPQSITQVLSHWSLGADPSAYNWEASERAVADYIDADQEDLRKKREKARRKKERQAKRQKREDRMFTEKKVESQPLVGGLRSSPGPGAAPSSSQVPQSQGIGLGFGFGVQSQMDPGRHGGRPAKKKKGKSRMSGF